MELENYKDNYDMFGRGGVGEEVAERGAYGEGNTLDNPVQSIIRLKRMNQQRVQT